MEPLGKVTVVQRLRRRIRSAILRPTAQRQPTFASWAADLLRLFLMLAAAGALVTVLLAGTPFLRAATLSLFGYRAIGALDTVLVTAFFVIMVPLCFIAVMFAMVAILWSYRSEAWFVPQLIVCVASVSGLCFCLFWFVLAPKLNAGQHLNNWPAELQLTAFEVCAIEVNELSSRTVAPVGRISIELLNRSPLTIRDAMFSVKAGSNWYHVGVENLASGEKRRLAIEADLGTIEAQFSVDLSWAQRSGEIYWDHVQPGAALQLRLRHRPEIADVSPIPDCPRFDISGIWKGVDGTELRLSQRGVHPQGYVRGGAPFGLGSSIFGTFDGVTFDGSFAWHAGRTLATGAFKLKFTADGKLEGEWSAAAPDGKRQRGAWNLTKIGPGPPAPRRRG